MVSIKKNKNKVWVTFTYIPKNDVDAVMLVGEWSGWEDEPMKRKKNGDFYLTKIFKIKSNYQFGYRCNNTWQIDESCASVCSPFDSENALLTL